MLPLVMRWGCCHWLGGGVCCHWLGGGVCAPTFTAAVGGRVRKSSVAGKDH